MAGVNKLGRLKRRLGFAAALAAGCAAAPVPTVGTGAPADYVVRASQYAFTTDFAIDRRDPLVLDLVGLREEIHNSLDLPVGETLIRVAIFDSGERYQEYLRANFPELPDRRAFFLKLADGQLVVFAVRGVRLQEDLRHEVTHALLHSSLPAVPIWLDEGLAQFFEVGPERNGVNSQTVLRLRSKYDPMSGGGRPTDSFPDLRRLESLNDLWEMSPGRYRESWLWVHFCLRHSEATRRAFLDHLSDLRGAADDEVEQRPSLADRLEEVLDVPLDKAVLMHLAGLTVELAREPHAANEGSYHRPWRLPWQ